MQSAVEPRNTHFALPNRLYLPMLGQKAPPRPKFFLVTSHPVDGGVPPLWSVDESDPLMA